MAGIGLERSDRGVYAALHRRGAAGDGMLINHSTDNSLETFVPLESGKRGQRCKGANSHSHDVTLLEGLGRAFYWQKLLDSGVMQSGSAISRAEKLHPSVVNELFHLTLLAPDIVGQFLAGRQPRRLNLMWFQRNPLPVDWKEQRQLMQRFEEEE